MLRLAHETVVSTTIVTNDAAPELAGGDLALLAEGRALGRRRLLSIRRAWTSHERQREEGREEEERRVFRHVEPRRTLLDLAVDQQHSGRGRAFGCRERRAQHKRSRRFDELLTCPVASSE